MHAHLAPSGMIETMMPLLIRGLRNGRLHGGESWYELVTRAVRGEWPALAASPRTLKAELGLGIVGKPYYFYVLRAEDTYSFVVFVVSETAGTVWPQDARGATPFDSGGWWWGKIRTDPPLKETTRRTAFRMLDVPLREWQDAFEQYIHSRYGRVGDYIEGHAPRSGCEPAETGFTVIEGQPNNAQAWTWEVRVPHELIAGRLILKKVYMDKDDRDEYIEWLWHRSALADSERLRVERWVMDHVEMPMQYDSVLRTVRQSIAVEVGVG